MLFKQKYEIDIEDTQYVAYVMKPEGSTGAREPTVLVEESASTGKRLSPSRQRQGGPGSDSKRHRRDRSGNKRLKLVPEL